MSKVFKTVAKIAPVAAMFIPGVGPAIGAALGATGATAGLVGSSVLGAASGALNGGGLKGALLGGATGGNLAGSLATSALGASGLGSALGKTLSNGLGSVGQKLGDIAGVAGSGKGIQSTGGYAGNLGGAGGSSMFSGSKLSNLLSSVGTGLAQSKAEEDMLKAQRAAQAQLSPYAQSGQAANTRLSELLGVGGNAQAQDYGILNKQFNAADLQNDAGYQFRLGEGLKAQQRALGAQGGLFSGAALKAAQEYGQGLADQTYNDAYNRDLQGKQTTYNQLSGLTGTGQNAATNVANILGTQGDIKANAGLARANLLNSTFSNILSGAGRKIVGYNPDGTPVYEDSIYG